MIALLVGVVLGIVSACLYTVALSTLWTWFAAAQYGPGPSHASWFGAATIAMLLIRSCLIGVKRDDVDDSAIGVVVGRGIGQWVGIAVVLGIAWLVGLVTGWGP